MVEENNNNHSNSTYIFETSWEVCNKVGGIYAVLTSKMKLMKSKYKNYIAIGPFLDNFDDFEMMPVPVEFLAPFKYLEDLNIQCYYGRWKIPGTPNAILIDSRKVSRDVINSIKYSLWEDYKIESMDAGYDFDEPLIWSYSVGTLLNEIEKVLDEDIIAQFHEWMSGFGIFKLKSENSRIKTIFTTHATMLGRSISGNGQNLYDNLDSINPEEKAKELNVLPKFSAERACAKNAHIFTTVSNITGIEAEKLLGKKPDVLLYNGILTNEFPSIQESLVKQMESKRHLRDFLAYYFFPHYTFDLNDSFFLYTSGRYEFGNKGMDVLIDSLGNLNRILKEKGSSKTVVAFFLIATGNEGVNRQVLESKSSYRLVKDYCFEHSEDVFQRLIYDALSNTVRNSESYLPNEIVENLKDGSMHFKKSGNAPLYAFKPYNENYDPTIIACKEEGLLNREEDRVKIVFCPAYFDGYDGLINYAYNNLVSGMDLGIFASLYEPWGYTPMESAALGVPAITTDLAGFGRFIKEFLNENNDGIKVLQREGKSSEQIIKDLTKMIEKYLFMNKTDISESKISAMKLVKNTDWKKFIENYFKAYEMALKK